MAYLQRTTRKVVVLGFEGVQSLDVVGPMEVFAVANLHSPAGRRKPYEVRLATQAGGELGTHAGLRLAGAVALADLPERIDTLVVGGGSEQSLRRAATDPDLLAWLQARARRTRRIASVCTGAFVLAAAGLLDGRRATTHWNACGLLKTLRPAIQVEPDAIFVADPPFYTSAGVSTGIDLCLSLVEADCGPEVALAVARELVLFLRRPGGQSQFSTGLRLQCNATPRLRALLAAIIDDPRGDLRGPVLAARAGMSERTFARAFARETGEPPARFVEGARVERAKTLLEGSEWRLERIAERAGFGSVDALHRAFLKRIGVTPGEYRERFGPPARGPAEAT
ncbi:GlxA family transcriptional regulator [Cupriavidus basilensis]|uniref:DJ-1/PfpI family protein n=1 Tax=Cupriavidus basilensis TaxID=68895 RepID=A0A643FXR0_9BURK|nr:helix-turn-helix domain-containing protein [Cupriavidus basilensis]QOT79889.1 DJ-1/PfpI family protein [Cupriavidus basilensis]